MRRAGPVGGHDGPFVVQDAGARGAQGQHGFDGQHRSGDQQWTPPGFALVGQERVHVHPLTDGVPAVTGDDAIAAAVLLFGGAGALLDRVRDVRQAVPHHHGGDTGLHRVAGGLRQRRVGGYQVPDAEGDRGVAVPAVDDCAAVDRHQVAVPQHLVGSRDAMHHPVVHRRADARRKAVIAQEGRRSTRLPDNALGHLVKLLGGYSRRRGLLDRT